LEDFLLLIGRRLQHAAENLSRVSVPTTPRVAAALDGLWRLVRPL